LSTVVRSAPDRDGLGPRATNQYIEGRWRESPCMSLERDYDCSACDEERTFYRAASTTLRLGEKVKWRCPECGYSIVTIGDDIDSTVTA